MVKNADRFDDVAQNYDEGFKELLGVWGDNIDRFSEYKIEQLRSLLLSTPERILDFGCGVGHSLKYFRTYFPNAKLYGCDVSKESLKIAKGTEPEANIFCNLPIETFASMNENWDLVFLACVLHHIEPEDRCAWIKAIASTMSLGGYLAIFEHNTINPCTKKIILDPRNYTDNITFMLSQTELVKLLLESYDGFEVYWKGYTLFSPIRAKWLIPVECALKWLPLGAQHCVIVQKIK